MEPSDPINAPMASVSLFAPDAAGSLPSFLIISPPKTGSTWLAVNLRCHPEIFIPEIKEVKYFSSYCRWLDLNWYAGHFKEGGDRLKGEASPSYAILPSHRIQLVRALVPHVKLIFLMRDPVERAWSHARHNHRYQEANFEGRTDAIEAVPDDAWRRNFRHDWPLASGDYLGQLQRWLAAFPREQIFVDFYERIRTDPEGLLARMFEFLGVDGAVDWSAFRTAETILPGTCRKLSSSLAADLRSLLRSRTEELCAFLDNQLDLCVEDCWSYTLGGEAPEDREPAPSAGVEVGRWDGGASARELDPETDGESDGATARTLTPARGAVTLTGFHGASARQGPDAPFLPVCDDARLEALLQTMDSPRPRVIVERFLGYNIVLFQGRFLAVTQELGNGGLDRFGEADSGTFGEIPVSDSLESAKEKITRHVLDEQRQERARWKIVEADLRAQIAECAAAASRAQHALASRQEELARKLAELDVFVSRLRSSLVFRLRRRLARLIRRRG